MGDSAEETYRRTIEVINRAVGFVAAKTAGRSRFGGPAAGGGRLDDRRRADLLTAVLPVVRGALSSEQPKILTADTSDRAVEFVSSADAMRLAGHTRTRLASRPDLDDHPRLSRRQPQSLSVARGEMGLPFSVP